MFGDAELTDYADPRVQQIAVKIAEAARSIEG